MADAQRPTEASRIDYNTVRPHSALGGATPSQFALTSVRARRREPPRPDQFEKPEELTLSV
jgi:transposase InsO family protein